MTIVELISNEAAGERRRLLIGASLAGAANALVLALVNVAAADPAAAGLRLFAIFGLAIVLYILGASHTYHRTIYLIETALHRLRTRIVAKIERTEFQQMERIGSAEIMDRLTENMAVVSDAASLIGNLLQSLCILVFATIYLAWHSLPAFGLLTVLITTGMFVFISKKGEISEYLQQTAQVRLTFFDLMTDLLSGFKEIKFSRRRGRELRGDIVLASDALRTNTAKANVLFEDNMIVASCNLFVALGALVFVLPRHVAVEASTQSSLVAGVMFIWSSVGGIAMGYPMYLRSNQALLQIQALEEKLDADARDREASTPDDTHDPWQGQVGSIEVRGLEYEYASRDDAATFRIGPLNLAIATGEVVFIVGGNGSGKSTFLKVLTGLYRPTAGALRVNGVLVQPSNAPSYREMISAIYSDFHLFAKLYGLLGVDEASVQRLLSEMQLDGKTSFAHQRFTNRKLSTGQRKRLALIVTLLEDRPICLFDEWAADQDPEFRRYFYEELVPALKQRNKTVIAVSHDDRYFRCADRVVKMEYGKIRAVERMSPAGAVRADAETIA